MSILQNFGGASVFNARDLKSTEVAGGFIAPAAFRMLLSDSHCVLEGPRGSGKTTLLRMLTPESYGPWAMGFDSFDIDFIGVFVPADVRWAKQLETRAAGLSDAVKKYFMEAAFSVATGLAIVETIEGCMRGFSSYGTRFPNVFLKIQRSHEAEIVKVLSSLWHLSAGVPSFSGLKASLRARQQEVGILLALAQAGETWTTIVNQNKFLAVPWLDGLVTGLQSVNEVLGRREQRWAILLDELEIVPSQILEIIVQALRSTDPSIKFKLAISPTGTDLMFGGDSSAPSQENDYRAIPLWYEKRRDARAFAEKLFTRALFGENAGDIDLKKSLGASKLQSEDDDRTTETADSAKKSRIESFVSLYAKDDSFKADLDKRGINPKNPPLSDESKIGTYVRKITPLVLLRDKEIKIFRNGNAVRRGGRRSGEAYFGYPNLLDLAEGNPRWILTLADLLKASGSVSDASLKSQGVQASVLEDFTKQFVSKLTVYPTGAGPTSKSWTLMKFIDSLGDELGRTLYRREFSADPALSFKLDERALSQFGNYIKLCIDLGALVIVRGGAAPLGEACGSPSLAGARVRISYRLAPIYQLPLRSTKERSLSGALRGGELLQGELAADEASILPVEKVPAKIDSPETKSGIVPQQGRLL
ncbi:hypothetical protein [Xanthomonas euvesicatoria]|uniref:ORC-CDC6 family AAA ATPase n=1 Tax=Xanthomonas euvesicatoria TaxID=456327 RepID=UPI002405D9C1|nr:hypothetical protein [Xanthomonas euvesicatoria]MCP3035513.1 hypothetical protein [Xanthomonas euvesicatoria pv. allii]